MTPPSYRSWNSAWGSPVSPGTSYTPDTSREASPRSPAKYTVPQKRPGIPPPPVPFEHGQVNLFASLLHPLAPVHETPEGADDPFALPPPSAFRPQAAPFVPRLPAPPAAPVHRREEAQLPLRLDLPDDVIEAIAQKVAVVLSEKENPPPTPPAMESPTPTPAVLDSAKSLRVADVMAGLDRFIQDLACSANPAPRSSIAEEVLRRPPGAAPSSSVTASSNPSAMRS